MGRLRQVIGDDGLGYETAVMTTPAKTVDHEVQAQIKRYEQECGPVTTRPLIEWIEPAATVRAYKAPVVSVLKHGLSFNRAAVEILGKPKRVFVGVTATGEIAVKPAPEGRGYALSISEARGKVYGATAGRDALARQLEEKGLKKGWYRLEYDEKLGAFIGRRIEP